MGNSCYMNSILQLLWRIPELQEEYVSKAERLFETAPEDPYNDFITQVRISGWPDWLKKRLQPIPGHIHFKLFFIFDLKAGCLVVCSLLN